MKLINCKRCDNQDYDGIMEQIGGLCVDCATDLKQKEEAKAEKKRRHEESGYFQNTGKYNKKSKLKSTWRW